ncbi:esterase-like activity of phytase family protein [Luteibacter sp. CQ10]|uniref:esterase-like activity of phytase family protein n=1 Tax=Luteibacter sp. CQ10 TaxID=2805821 RepID=UPI0034A36EDA
MRVHLVGLIATCLIGSVAAESLEVRKPDIATAPLPRSIEDGGVTYVDQGLVAAGSLPAGTVDFLGDTLGSFSSLQIEPGTWRREGDTYTGVLWTLPDRGRNDPEHGLFYDYRGRMHRFRITVALPRSGFADAVGSHPSGSKAARDAKASLPKGWEPIVSANPARSVGTVTIMPYGGKTLKDFNGKAFTGAEPAKGILTEHGIVLPAPAKGIGAGKISLDAESLQFTRDGGFYVGDEYAANVYRFDRSGKLTGIIVPPKAIRPLDKDGKPDFTSLKPPATGRRNNQGVEGMALSPDGTRLFVALQSALVQDSLPGDASGRTLTRVLVYDVSHDDTPSTPIGHYVVELPSYTASGDGGTPDKTAAQSEIRVLDDHRFLMLARDGAGWGAEGGKPIVFKQVMLVDIDGATNLAGTPYETDTRSVLEGKHLRDDIHAASSKPFVNLLDPDDLARAGLGLTVGEGRAQISEKWEAMDLVPALDAAHPDDVFLLVGNDNDFIAKHCVMDGQRCDSPIDNDNRVLVYRLTLPGFRSTTAPNH